MQIAWTQLNMEIRSLIAGPKKESFGNPNLIYSPLMVLHMQLTHTYRNLAYILPLRLSSLH